MLQDNMTGRGAVDHAEVDRLRDEIARLRAQLEESSVTQVESARRSEQTLRLALQAGRLAVWEYRTASSSLTPSPELARLLGTPEGGDIAIEDIHRGYLPGQHERVSNAAQAALARGEPFFEVEFGYRRPDGQSRTFLVRADFRFDEAANITGVIGVLIDVTAQKDVEAEVKAALERLAAERHALEVLNRLGMEIGAELDLDKVVQQVVDAGVELTGAKFGAFFYNVLDERGESYMLYALAGVPREAFANYPMPRNTAIFSTTFSGEGVLRSDDITKDPRYGLSDPHHGMPKDHIAVVSYLAVPVTSRSGKVLGGLFFGHPEPGVFGDRAEQLTRGLSGQAAVAIDNARLFQAVQQANATLEQRVAEAVALRNSIWQNSSELMAVFRSDGEPEAINPAWARVLGRPEEHLLAMPLHDLTHPDDRATLADIAGALGGGEAVHGFEHRLRHADGSYRLISWTGVPGPGVFYAIGRDITEQRATEDALRQAQKMEAIGQLTGGIAHDFNNLLAGIVGGLDLVRKRIASGRADEAGRFIDAAMTSANRAANLTHRLLAFSRRQSLDVRPTDVNAVVLGMEDLLRRTLGENIVLGTLLKAGLWLAKTDVNQFESAILNLAINARDAMPEGGKLTIETANTQLDESYTRDKDGLHPGDYVVMCVSDTGTGMEPAVIARAFEPFFTTKPIGQGTGLGLSMIYGFLKQIGGHARIYSEPGDGTTVKLYLPRLVEDVGISEEPSQEVPRAGAGERVLVVEDDAAVRMLVLDVLEELGYAALEAVDARSATPFLEGDERIDLLISDVGLPGLNGRQLAEIARQKRPTLPVLFITGYAEGAAVRGGFLAPGMEMVTKPFAIDTLARKIRSMLGEG